MNTKKIGKKSAMVTMVAIAILVGGVTVLKVSAANAQIPTPAATSAPTFVTSQTQSSIGSSTSGKFKSNEDPTHESKESVQWEAQENAGQAPWQQ